MNKFDKYYLKKGKLELSILDDDEYDEGVTRSIENKQAKVKIDKDISSTLHRLSQYLSKADNENEVDPNAARAKELDRIASSIKIQDVSLEQFELKKEPVQEPVPEPVKEEVGQEVEEIEAIIEDEIASTMQQSEVTEQERLSASNEVADESLSSQIEDYVYYEEKDDTYEEETEGTSYDFKDDIYSYLEDEIEDKQVAVSAINESMELEDRFVEEIPQELEENEEENKEDFKQVTGLERFKCILPFGENLDLEVKEMYEQAAKEVEELYGKKDIEELVAPKAFSEQKQSQKGQYVAIFEDDRRVTDLELSQGSIDDILEGYFGKVTPKYAHAEELKRIINQRVATINNYDAN